MGKQLYLLRHANAEDARTGQEDHERPLSKKGKDECKLLCNHLKKHALQPDALFISSSKRTRQTAEEMEKDDCLKGTSLHYIEQLYLASAGELLHIIHHLPENKHNVMIVAHNPGIYELLALLTSSDYHDTLVSGMPTCGLAVLEFNVTEWQNITPETGILTHCFKP